eukprot:Nitzschia sp. Nitz4//scaffold13_size275219//60790//64230//NITZ4_000854-RA/size275219-snap-gene-0.39-mRNA-1//-1//CDS//3329535954//4895//frame0
MQHTYLRYECADAFGLLSMGATSKAPQSNSILAFASHSRNQPVLLTTAGSHCLGIHARTASPTIKLGHREELGGGVGTGRALNSGQVVCVAVSQDPANEGCNVATGWVDGAVRVFRLEPGELNAEGGHGLVQSLLQENHPDENFVMREPLVLNGHSDSPIRSIAFDSQNSSRLVSGSADGVLCVWDVVEETGLFRLLGHRGAITDVHFVSLADGALDLLVSTSLDGFVKVWDLKGQCCIQTITSHRGEVWGAACFMEAPLPDVEGESEEPRIRLLTGGTDGVARVFAIKPPVRSTLQLTEQSLSDEGTSDNVDDCCHYIGPVISPPSLPTTGERISCMHFHPNGRFVGILHVNSKDVNIYMIRSTKESQRKKLRRQSRKKEKVKAKANTDKQSTGTKRGILDDPEPEVDNTEVSAFDKSLDPEGIRASDEFEYFGTARASHKVKGFAFVPWKEGGSVIRVACSLTTNAIEIVALNREKTSDSTQTAVTSTSVASMNMIGHPTGIRSVSLSSDDTLAVTISKSSTKIWNVTQRACIQSTTPSVGDVASYGLCCAFMPGNSHLILGTREGHLLLVEVASGEVVSVEEQAHDGAIWSLDIRRPTKEQPAVAIVTGSADKTVKFWEIDESEDGTPELVHARTLEMTDDVLAVKYSHSVDPTKRMVFISTLDSTVKVFFDDTLKFFLSLYGHKLPALALDASDDDTILATSGADKTIKIWGLDFGDTHRTLHGHQDSVTDLKFVRRTHNFFTTSKDGTVRYWDGDRFEQILVLNGHCAEVSGIAISRTGAFVLSAGMDRQVRVWERTKDIVFLEEERERELDKMFDRVDANDERGTAKILNGNVNEEEDTEDEPQSAEAVKKSMMSVAAGDRLLEALERADQETKSIAAFKKSNPGKEKIPNPLLMGMDPPAYVLWALKSVKLAELEQSLLILPLGHVERMIYYLVLLLRSGRGVEICARVGTFLVKTHHHQILASNKSLAVPLRELRRLLKARLEETKNVVGFNMAALRAVQVVATKKAESFVDFRNENNDIWAGLGLGRQIENGV